MLIAPSVRTLVALLLFLGVAATANQAFAGVEESGTNENPRLTNIMVKDLGSYAAKLRGSAVVGDTTYVGYTPGKASNKNPWSIGAGFSPQNSNIAGDGHTYHRPYAGQGGMWDWEPTGGSYIKGDSLQGWWPDRPIMTGTGGQTRPDWSRPWWAIDIGNKVNYRLNKAGNRTYGVVGVWHRDDAGAATNAGSGATAPAWAPIGGSFSAWMGLRASGDTRFSDPITGQPFNEDALIFTVPGSTTPTGSDNGFPGYASQMDQMLYRDIDMTGNTARDLTISFTYRLRMSTGFGTAAATRVGWFDKDPLVVTNSASAQATASLGNFISSSDAGAAGAPRDSFMVYVGAPVEGTFLASTGNSLPVFDAQRRWFDEVVRANETGLYKEIQSDTGLVLPTTRTVTISNTTLAPMLTASQGRVRLVFRVKTNRGFDDQGTAYSSAGGGAAVIDNVTYQMVGGPASAAGWGDFESEGSINNAVSTPATEAWKATGKPPGHYAHVVELSTLLYDDLCGQPGDASRICSMDGVVISLGDFDNNEAASSLIDGTADYAAWQNCFSPTIQLRSDNGVWPNPIGLKTPGTGAANGDANATEDYWVDYEMYAGIMDPFSKGGLWRYGIMAWPGKGKVSMGGYPNWSNVRYPPYILFNPDQQCFRDILDNPIKGNGMMVFDANRSESPDWPDSVRIVIGNRVECFRFGLSSCGSTDGNYWDNVSLAIIDGGPQPIQAQIWDLYQDTFPANEGLGLAGFAAAFDTTTAWVKTGVNIAPTGPTRFDVPGDSVAITTSDGDNTRVDLIFRILPGPGNYVNLGRPDLSPLRKLPNSPTPIGAPSSASSNFWENYLANNGPKGTPGGHPGGEWNPNVWNSARMDTAEVAIFAFQGRGIVGGPGAVTGFQGTYHESELGIASDPSTEAGGDPYPVTNIRTALGIPRSRCFVAAAGAVVTDVQCNGAVPAYVGTSGIQNPLTGFDGSALTIEGTKIIPDGYLTPGAHVQYFFRREDAPGGVVTGLAKGLMPDTSHVFPQNGEGSTDAHRWQQFGVLPDRWKSPSYRHPVLGSFGVNDACMLAVDNNDRRGDERVFIAVMDTIGGTQAAKYGAHNGWHAPGTGNDAVNDPANFVAKHIGQAGTTFDLYNIKASESLNTNSGSLGSRLAFRDAANTQITGKSARNAPTPDMLKAYYRMIFQFTGDVNFGVMGPFLNKTQDDVAILTNWLESGDPTTPNRAYWAQGDGFVESNFGEGSGSDQDLFDVNYLGVDLRNNSYVLESGNTERTPDLTAPIGSPLAQYNDIFGVQNLCLWTNDVLLRTSGLSGQTQNALAYENAGPGPFPILSSVSKSHTALKPWISVVDGWDMIHLRSRFDTDSKGRNRYFYAVMLSVFWGVCPLIPNIPCFVECTDVPPGDRSLTDYVALANNPVRSGSALIPFGLAATDWVDARVFDIAGRMVRQLANRRFQAGEHRLVWDGLDDQGRRLPRGVYFTHIKFTGRGFDDRKKITLLR